MELRCRCARIQLRKRITCFGIVPTQVDSPDSGIGESQYDPAGNRIVRTDARGISVQYRYDALNRLTHVYYPDDALDVTFEYDQGTYGKGRLTGMTDATGTTAYEYDMRGNRITETRTILAVPYVTGYGYDSADRLVQITYPSGRVVDFPRDAIGRVSTVSTTFDGHTEVLADSIAYDPFGPLTDFVYGNDLPRSLDFDLDGRVRTIQSLPILSLDYGYDLFDRIGTLDDLLTPQLNQSYDYDLLDRITFADGDYGTFLYGYDGVATARN